MPAGEARSPPTQAAAAEAVTPTTAGTVPADQQVVEQSEAARAKELQKGVTVINQLNLRNLLGPVENSLSLPQILHVKKAAHPVDDRRQTVLIDLPDRAPGAIGVSAAVKPSQYARRVPRALLLSRR
jgi:hypothetical protein